MGFNENRDEGAYFEGVFEFHAKRCGMYPKKNYLTARHQGYSGRVKVLKSNLDYTLITQEGRVGYFDCKSFQGENFTYSMIDIDQLKLADTYFYWNVPTGFIVWLRQINKVVFYTPRKIIMKGARNSFGVEDGLLLGSLESCDLRPVMNAK